MCLIIFSPKIETAKSKIWKPVLERGFRHNSHGAGFSYIKNGKVKITKAFFDFDKFYTAYTKATKDATGPFLIHFRFATHGSHNHVNTQPIPVIKKELAMAHNGVFSQLSFDHLDVSDSVYLANTIKKMRWQFPFNESQTDILTALCNGYSKLVFMDKHGNYQFINEHLGAWKNGAWYSDKGACWEKPSPVRVRRSKVGEVVDEDDMTIYRSFIRSLREDGPSDDDPIMQSSFLKNPVVRQSSILKPLRYVNTPYKEYRSSPYYTGESSGHGYGSF